VLDSKGPIIGNCDSVCVSVTPDQYSVNFTSFQTPPLSGIAQARGLQFGTSEIIDPFTYESGITFVDNVPAMSLLDVLMLPSMFDNTLLASRLSYTDTYTICTDLCRTDYTQTTRMRIDSLVRYVDVPEPGTLGLLGLGFVGTLLSRRRRGDPTPA
jgi:hypothetical protein